MLTDLGKLTLRLTLGILVLLHGVAKLTGGIDGIQDLLDAAGLPRWLGFGVYLGEVLGPLLVIAGYHARIGAVLIVVNMLFAIGLVHAHEVFALTAQGGWAIELQAMFLFSALAVVLMGPGRLSLNRR